MRLDKFLKVSRLIKRRTLAKEVCSQGRIDVNGQTAKASTIITGGDELSIRYGSKRLTVRVTQLKESTRKEDASMMYEIVSEERLPPNESVVTSGGSEHPFKNRKNY